MIKKWEVTAEVNMDASNYVSIIVSANTKRKAMIIAEEKLKKKYFFVTNMNAREIDENGRK